MSQNMSSSLFDSLSKWEEDFKKQLACSFKGPQSSISPDTSRDLPDEIQSTDSKKRRQSSINRRYLTSALGSQQRHQQGSNQIEPWRRNPRHFNRVEISPLALMKMASHAYQGGDLEIMGLMLGKVDTENHPRTMLIMDSFGLPVDGTETRVNAQAEAYEYMVQFLSTYQRSISLKNANSGHLNVIGWYHSHPGYGCWLSGIDVETQLLNQQYQEPFLAVVIDPHKTRDQRDRVEIGAFRTLPESAAGRSSNRSSNEQTSVGDTFERNADGQDGIGPLDPNEIDEYFDQNMGEIPENSAFGIGTNQNSYTDGLSSAYPTNSIPIPNQNEATTAISTTDSSNLPAEKLQDFGVHANRYYSLEVDYFKSDLDEDLLRGINQRQWKSKLTEPMGCKDRQAWEKNLTNQINNLATNKIGNGLMSFSAVNPKPETLPIGFKSTAAGPSSTSAPSDLPKKSGDSSSNKFIEAELNFIRSKSKTRGAIEEQSTRIANVCWLETATLAIKLGAITQNDSRG